MLNLHISSHSYLMPWNAAKPPTMRLCQTWGTGLACDWHKWTSSNNDGALAVNAELGHSDISDKHYGKQNVARL